MRPAKAGVFSRSQSCRGKSQRPVAWMALSNLYLNEVDRMLERAKELTGKGTYTYVEYARFADDLVVLIDDGHWSQKGLFEAVERRLRGGICKTWCRDQRGKESEGGPSARGELRISGVRLSPGTHASRALACALYA